MADLKWTIEFTGQAKKAAKVLPTNALAAFKRLLLDLQNDGPNAHGWKNYSQIHTNSYHCHLKKGKPTYVAFWRAHKNLKIIEVYYAGTHESAPY